MIETMRVRIKTMTRLSFEYEGEEDEMRMKAMRIKLETTRIIEDYEDEMERQGEDKCSERQKLLAQQLQDSISAEGIRTSCIIPVQAHESCSLRETEYNLSACHAHLGSG